MIKGERTLPLYQGMMTTFFDHRAADVVKSETAVNRQNQPRYVTDFEKADPARLPMPQYWVRESLVDEALPDWLLAFSDITSPTNERTLVPVAIPRVGIGNTAPIVLPTAPGVPVHCLLACLSSFVVDYVARLKVGGTHLNYFYVRQFPVLVPAKFTNPAPWDSGVSLATWIADRTSELVATATDLVQFSEVASAAPFKWDTARRSCLRAELDAAMFHLYGVGRDDLDYIMDTFPIVKRKDEAAYGEYRTKRLILEIYDRMAEAVEHGVSYVSPLDLEESQ